MAAYVKDENGELLMFGDDSVEQLRARLTSLRERMLTGDPVALEWAEGHDLTKILDFDFFKRTIAGITDSPRKEGWKHLPPGWSEKISALGAAEDALSGRWNVPRKVSNE